MNLIDESVKHSLFGEGKVINQEEGRISVRFPEQYGTKQFIYPDAFEKYLKLDNSNLEMFLREEINSKKVQIEAEKLQKQLEYEGDLKAKALEKSASAASRKKSTTKSNRSKPKK